MMNASRSAVWERGMFAQRRRVGADDGPLITLIVEHDSSSHELYLSAQRTFGEVKKILVRYTGLEPEKQCLFYRGVERENEEQLLMQGVKDKSKICLLENDSGKKRKLEQMRKYNEMLKAFGAVAGARAEANNGMLKATESVAGARAEVNNEMLKPAGARAIVDNETLKAVEAVAGIRVEVDKLSEKVSALKVAVDRGTKVADKEFLVSTELLMRQLLKLHAIQAEGEAKMQRKAEVRRVLNFVDALDSLRARNSKL